MTYAAYDTLIGAVDLSQVDAAGPGALNQVAGTGSGRANFYNEELRGYDPALGGGTFIYAKYSGTIAAGVVVELTPSLSSGIVINSATAWAGTANTGRPLAVSLSAGVAGQWGWFQVQGSAIVTVSGAPAAGNPVYWQAAGVPSPTGVASKQMVNAQFQTAVSQTVGGAALSATQAVVYLNRPFAQGAIT
jgi:hypothetical protein